MNEIRRYRTELGLSQHQLADLLGTSRSFLSLAELGRRTLTPSAFLRLTDMVAESRRHVESGAGEPEIDAEILARLEALREEQSAELALRREEATALRDRLQRQVADKETRNRQAAMAIAQLRSELALVGELPTVNAALQRRLQQAQHTWEVNHPVHCAPLVRRIAELDALIALWDNQIAS